MAEKMTGKVVQNHSQMIDGTSTSSAGMTASTIGAPVDVLSDGPNTLGELSGDDDTIMTIANDRCYLLEMILEIRQKIWSYAVQEQKVIEPKQIVAHSNKFVPTLVAHTLKPGEFWVRGKVYPEPMPAAAQMSLVCHQIYDEISGSCLFYQVNEFKFDDTRDMLAYLVAIAPIRANSIRSVSINTPALGKANKATHAFNMLANCQGLRHLKIKILLDHSWSYYMYQEELIPGRNGLKNIRGLETIHIEYGLLSENPNWRHLDLKVDLDDACRRTAAMRQEVAFDVLRPRQAIPHGKIQAARQFSGLNIHGEGRLGPDKKPGIISSRTRAQLMKQQGFNEDGVSRDAEVVPKYGEFGDLLWDIRRITESREFSGDSGQTRIEVFVTWANGSAKSWELLDNVIGIQNVFRVARHYIRHPDAYDASLAIATIKELVEKCPEKTSVLYDLSILMKRRENSRARSRFQRLCRSVRYRPDRIVL